jgi:triosephosphate isomerase
MYKTVAEAEALVRELAPKVAAAAAEVVVCPPFTALEGVARALEGTNIALGAQNAHWEDEGAYTGEVSAAMLADLGVKFVIVGHSERRQHFGEDDAMVNQRALGVLDQGLIPIVCVGERLEHRSMGQIHLVVSSQIRGSLEGFTREQMLAAVIAYEPVWAIGTGRTATPEQAQEVHALIRKLLSEAYDAETAERIRIQYGGSVKPDNAAGLLAQPDIDGALVGGASLQAEAFAAIVAAAV